MLSVLRAGAQSGSILFVGDLLAQHVWANPWDYKRSAQWGVLGLCLHGPWFLMSFRKIDAFFGPATNMATVLKKTAAAQCLISPLREVDMRPRMERVPSLLVRFLYRIGIYGRKEHPRGFTEVAH
eukprot:GEMP01019106.1.p1 GENE.GEMP01019106.1~~GEMP01019106.1.p1  ORF type:complete len:125 (+),score=14.68 GEMP01019106.1:102-476(+)